MAIEPDVVKKVATLARLDISEQEVATYTGQLSNILGLMEQLNSLDTDKVPPMSHAVEMRIPERADQVVNGDQREAMLANAPEADSGHFRVPKIIE
ncbi:MAG: Asp-tRNA(Asn)/Glu-tRNA(Gln) amidotransferase subunit GatC [Magnetococcales bacterium]|nr:Asp-tRNA(Asn)/Glu-tRNA(Gln) amidotransferase subunit GatC [Magnetococcales bacterium]